MIVFPPDDWTAPVELLVPDAGVPVAVADATDMLAVKDENAGRVTPALEQSVCA